MDADFIADHLHWDPKNKSIYSDVPIGFTGEMKIWPMSTPPDGWLICDGRLVLKTDYPALWRLLGDTWGTSTTTQFFLPNLKGKTAVGLDSSQTEFTPIAKVGGDKNMASHTHQTINASGFDGNILIGGTGGTGNAGISYGQAGGGYRNSGFTNTGSAGSGASGNLQPYAVVQYIIKA